MQTLPTCNTSAESVCKRHPDVVFSRVLRHRSSSKSKHKPTSRMWFQHIGTHCSFAVLLSFATQRTCPAPLRRGVSVGLPGTGRYSNVHSHRRVGLCSSSIGGGLCQRGLRGSFPCASACLSTSALRSPLLRGSPIRTAVQRWPLADKRLQRPRGRGLSGEPEKCPGASPAKRCCDTNQGSHSECGRVRAALLLLCCCTHHLHKVSQQLQWFQMQCTSSSSSLEMVRAGKQRF